MLMLSLSPLVTYSLIGLVFVVGVLGLIATTEHQHLKAHDPEREIQRLTLKLRHPVRYQVTRWLKG